MSNTIRIKRRTAGGAGAPSSLENAEIAFNEVDDVLYYGKGTGGAGGTATTVIPIAGPGQFIDKSTNQTIGGTKTFSSVISGSIDGNSGTSTKWATSRDLSVTGDGTATLSSGVISLHGLIVIVRSSTARFPVNQRLRHSTVAPACAPIPVRARSPRSSSRQPVSRRRARFAR